MEEEEDLRRGTDDRRSTEIGTGVRSTEKKPAPRNKTLTPITAQGLGSEKEGVTLMATILTKSLQVCLQHSLIARNRGCEGMDVCPESAPPQLRHSRRCP